MILQMKKAALLLALLVANNVVDSARNCRFNEHGGGWRRHRKKCYVKVQATTADWFEAKAMCDELHADLVLPTDITEAKFISEMHGKKYGRYWINVKNKDGGKHWMTGCMKPLRWENWSTDIRRPLTNAKINRCAWADVRPYAIGNGNPFFWEVQEHCMSNRHRYEVFCETAYTEAGGAGGDGADHAWSRVPVSGTQSLHTGAALGVSTLAAMLITWFTMQ